MLKGEQFKHEDEIDARISELSKKVKNFKFAKIKLFDHFPCGKSGFQRKQIGWWLSYESE